MRTGIATGAEAVLVPETPTDMNNLIAILDKRRKNQKSSSAIVIVAEGDDTGGAMEAAEEAKKALPGYDIRVAILGHIQRGGRPSCNDRVLASRLGLEAVKALVAGKKSVMIGQEHREIVFIPFDKAIKHNQRIDPAILEIVDILS
jgi:6-phosphofructokinase 1